MDITVYLENGKSEIFLSISDYKWDNMKLSLRCGNSLYQFRSATVMYVAVKDYVVSKEDNSAPLGIVPPPYGMGWV